MKTTSSRYYLHGDVAEADKGGSDVYYNARDDEFVSIPFEYHVHGARVPVALSDLQRFWFDEERLYKRRAGFLVDSPASVEMYQFHRPRHADNIFTAGIGVGLRTNPGLVKKLIKLSTALILAHVDVLIVPRHGTDR